MQWGRGRRERDEVEGDTEQKGMGQERRNGMEESSGEEITEGKGAERDGIGS